MQSRWRWLRSRPVMISAALVVVITTVALVLWLLQPITQANFDRIRIGMSQAELYSLLGPPEYETVEVGHVQGPGSYATNAHLSEEQLRERGFETFQRQQWTSSEITIMAILDSEGRVACRYSSEGRRRDPLEALRDWLSGWF